MDPGVGPGKHIPADTILIRGQRVNVIRWSDGPLQLGWYLGVLALESALMEPSRDSGFRQFVSLSSSSADRDRLNQRVPSDSLAGVPVHLRELYFALSALDRLDQRAEPIFARVCSGPADDVPGFFIRDDVSDSVEMRARMKRLWVESDYASLEGASCRVDPSRNKSETDEIQDCLADCPHCFNGEASQDQVYHLLLGLALVKHFVPPGTIVRGMDLNARATLQARRMITYLAQHDWEMINPVCGRPVRRGSFAKGYSYATACAAAYLSDGDYRPVGSSCLWTGAAWSANPVYQNPDNRHLAMVLAAVGDAWQAETFADLTDLAAAEDWHLYPLLHLVLHTPANISKLQRQKLKSSVYALLDSAPSDGPAFDGSPHPNPGWSSANRFLRGKARQQGEGESFGAIYNGLDYMLLYGLSQVAFQ